jgi:hypothetical protein
MESLLLQSQPSCDRQGSLTKLKRANTGRGRNQVQGFPAHSLNVETVHKGPSTRWLARCRSNHMPGSTALHEFSQSRCASVPAGANRRDALYAPRRAPLFADLCDRTAELPSPGWERRLAESGNSPSTSSQNKRRVGGSQGWKCFDQAAHGRFLGAAARVFSSPCRPLACCDW